MRAAFSRVVKNRSFSTEHDVDRPVALAESLVGTDGDGVLSRWAGFGSGTGTGSGAGSEASSEAGSGSLQEGQTHTRVQ